MSAYAEDADTALRLAEDRRRYRGHAPAMTKAETLAWYERQEELARRSRAACGAPYPGLFQPIACTLRGEHDGKHVDERRALTW